MKIFELAKILEAETVNLAEEKVVTGAYCGDFLSNVISKAPANSAWFTVMGNVNVAGVALLAEVAVIVLCEGVKPDPVLTVRVKEQKLNLIVTKLPVFEASVRFAKHANLL